MTWTLGGSKQPFVSLLCSAPFGMFNVLHFKIIDMEKKNKKEQPIAGVTHKKEGNAGSGTFNQGSEQDTEMNEGVADGTPHPETVSKEKQNPKAKLKEKHRRE